MRAASNEPAPLALHARAHAVLERAARAWLADPLRPVTQSLLYAAIATLNLGVLRDGVARAETQVRNVELDHAIDWSLSVLLEHQGGVDDAMAARIRREFERDPESPAAVQRFVWLGQREGQRYSDLVGLFHKMRQDASEPHLRNVLFYCYAQAREYDLAEDEARFAVRLQEILTDWIPDEKRDIAEARDIGPMPEPGADLARLRDYAQQMAEIDLTHGATLGPEAVRATFERLVAAIETAPMPDDWSFLTILQAAEGLHQLTRREFSWVSHFVEVPHAHGRPEHGVVDLQMFPALTHGLFAASAAFCRKAWARVEDGHPLLAAWALGRLLDTHTGSAGMIGDTAPAFDLLDRVDRHGIMPEVVAVLRDDLRLRTGDVAAAGADPPPMRRGSTAYRYLPHEPWSRAEGVAWQNLAHDASITGHFDLVWPDGEVRTYPHVTPEREVRFAPLHEVALLGEGLIIGPGGHMLQPNPYHTSHDYPIASRVVLAGQQGAVRIRPLTEARHEAPVVLMEACAALHWPNYYHWMIPHLSRLALAVERGLFVGRRLVIPEGLRPWMLETLDLIGLTAEQRLEIPFGQLTRFADATLLASIEHLSPAAIAALRRCMLGPASTAAAPPADGPFVYLSRGDLRDRMLEGEREIEALAAGMGFEIVRPEELGAKGQAELFARARGIAGPEGAAMTNTLYAAPGARVLAIVCVNDMMPVFTDLSLVLGHHHRKLAGRGATGPGAGTRFQPRFAVDPGVARAALEWVRSGT